MTSRIRSPNSVLVGLLFGLLLNAPVVYGQTDQDCDQLKKQIKELQDASIDISHRIAGLEEAIGRLDRAIQAHRDYEKDHPIGVWLLEAYHDYKWTKTGEKLVVNRNKLTKEVQDLKLTIQAIKDVIADLLNQLANCGKKAKGSPSPTPSLSPTSTPAPTPAPTEHALRTSTGDALGMLVRDGKVKINTTGTGETIGHVADLKIENLTDQPINCVVPPMVLESSSRKNQDYVCARPQTAKIDPHGTTTVPMDGVCVNRNKPPVGKDVSGDLVVNTGDPTVPQSPDSHVPADKARDLLRICTAKHEAAEKLQKDGALKDLPYKDKEKQKQIVEQWSTWSDPRISEITGAPPATKDDLKKVVYKQLEEKGPMSPETKKKVDQGVDTIFEKVELTTAKAKDLEKPQEPDSSPPAPLPQTY